MTGPAAFEWDDAKDVLNREKHLMPLSLGALVILDPDRLDIDATRTGDGEFRRKAIGRFEGRLFTVVYTLRGDVCRLISVRRSNAEAGRIYGHRS